ncbi:multiple inositol polyphosphate phosphatase 1-like [Atheta coriaria]|uniref:multiple inositol polyphosphate phosphatase 1-like n=1 Tax=Dalotia coriaria TaxID=877792 RepID=UPI0031F3D81F
MSAVFKVGVLLLCLHFVFCQQDYDPNDPYRKNNNNDPYSRNNDPYNRSNDPYSRNNQSGYNRTNDPYNRDRNDPYNRDRNDPYNRDRNVNDPYGRNDPNRDPNDPYNRNIDPSRNDPYNRNNTNRNDPYNRDRNDPYNRDRNDPYSNRDRNDPYSRSNDPNRDRNDPYNRDPNRDRNDPYNRDRDQLNRNDPYNRDPNRDRNDPYNRDRDHNRDPYSRDSSTSRYGQVGSGVGGGIGGSGTYGGSGSRYGTDDSNCCEEYCYNIDEQPYVKLGAKTPYQFVYGKISNQHIVPQCKPVQVWSLLREGTSVPDRQSIERYRQLQKIHDEIVRNYEDRRSFPDKGRLCAEDYDILRRWRWNDSLSDSMAGSLTQQGSDDIKFLARRYQTRLRELLQPYNDQLYYFQHTEGDRTVESYQAYIQGLFGSDYQRVHANVRGGGYSGGYGGNSYNQDANRYDTRSENYDPFAAHDNSQQNTYGSQYGSDTRYGSGSTYGGAGGSYGSSRCKSYQQRMDENRETATEYRSFKEKPEYKEMVRNVFRRLGFRYNLNDSLIEDMYDLCRYEKSWYVTRPSPWCAAFTPEQLKLLEYGDDLFYFYRSGYGHEYLNKNLGCGLVKDLYDRFERTVNGDTSEQKAIFHFRDLDTMLKTIVALGIRRDTNVLTADNYYQHTRRMWRTSEIAPFSGNLAAILYQCDNQAEKYKVMFFLNENPVDFPECSVGLCSWNTFQQKLQYLAQECRLDWCERGSANQASKSIAVILTALLVAAFFKY